MMEGGCSALWHRMPWFHNDFPFLASWEQASFIDRGEGSGQEAREGTQKIGVKKSPEKGPKNYGLCLIPGRLAVINSARAGGGDYPCGNMEREPDLAVRQTEGLAESQLGNDTVSSRVSKRPTRQVREGRPP